MSKSKQRKLIEQLDAAIQDLKILSKSKGEKPGLPDEVSQDKSDFLNSWPS